MLKCWSTPCLNAAITIFADTGNSGRPFCPFCLFERKLPQLCVANLLADFSWYEILRWSLAIHSSFPSRRERTVFSAMFGIKSPLIPHLCFYDKSPYLSQYYPYYLILSQYYPLLMTNIIENGPVEIVDFPIENGGSFHSYVTVYQRAYPIKSH